MALQIKTSRTFALTEDQTNHRLELAFKHSADMHKIIHTADSRGIAELGWLHSKHTFSFADYRNPERDNFGKLRVLNDDTIEPGSGFGLHPHQNMEIITIPISGELRHTDSMGNSGVITRDEIQVMSAGSGLTHSEFNNSDNACVSLLQIWILPKKLNIEPAYKQTKFDPEDRQNVFQTVVSPQYSDTNLTINQDAYLSRCHLEKGKSIVYQNNIKNNGNYIFIIDGQAEIANEVLNPRDAIAISKIDHIAVKACKNAELLVIEVPVA